MALDLTSANGKRMNGGPALSRTRHVERPRRRLPLPTLRAPTRDGDTRARQQALGALAQLPPARRGPALRSGRTRIVRPSLTGRKPQPMLPRLLAGEFQRRLILVLAGALIFVALVIVLGGSFFL